MVEKLTSYTHQHYGLDIQRANYAGSFLNKVHVAATELTAAVVTEYKHVWRGKPDKVAVRLCAAVKLTEKNHIVGT